MSTSTGKPEQLLTRLFLDMFSTDELRRLLRYNFSNELALSLPGANAAPMAVAEAASEAIIRRKELATLWPVLIDERKNRRAEIEAIRDTIMQELAKRAPVAGSGNPGANKPPEKAGPIRLLFVLSCPKSQYQLDLQEEVRQIRLELEGAPHRAQFTHELITAATYKDLRVALDRHKPHILHIACHATPEAEIVLSNGHGDEDLIDAPSFVELLDILKDDLRLVVLNACHSAAITKQILPVVDLVVGMRGAVRDSGAVAFSAVFYERISAGDTVEKAFRLAVNELRRRKIQADLPELLPAEGPQRQRRFASA